MLQHVQHAEAYHDVRHVERGLIQPRADGERDHWKALQRMREQKQKFYCFSVFLKHVLWE